MDIFSQAGQLCRQWSFPLGPACSVLLTEWLSHFGDTIRLPYWGWCLSLAKPPSAPKQLVTPTVRQWSRLAPVWCAARLLVGDGGAVGPRHLGAMMPDGCGDGGNHSRFVDARLVRRGVLAAPSPGCPLHPESVIVIAGDAALLRFHRGAPGKTS